MLNKRKRRERERMRTEEKLDLYFIDKNNFNTNLKE